VQVELHPLLSVLFESSQVSAPTLNPSPHFGEQSEVKEAVPYRQTHFGSTVRQPIEHP